LSEGVLSFQHKFKPLYLEKTVRNGTGPHLKIEICMRIFFKKLNLTPSRARTSARMTPPKNSWIHCCLLQSRAIHYFKSRNSSLCFVASFCTQHLLLSLLSNVITYLRHSSPKHMSYPFHVISLLNHILTKKLLFVYLCLEKFKRSFDFKKISNFL